jgi:hypothetical protein
METGDGEFELFWQHYQRGLLFEPRRNRSSTEFQLPSGDREPLKTVCCLRSAESAEDRLGQSQLTGLEDAVLDDPVFKKGKDN